MQDWEALSARKAKIKIEASCRKLYNRKSGVGELILFSFCFFVFFSHLDGCLGGGVFPSVSSMFLLFSPRLSFSSINQEKFQSQWDSQISQAENSFNLQAFHEKAASY